jgi:hypothetical protein
VWFRRALILRWAIYQDKELRMGSVNVVRLDLTAWSQNGISVGVREYTIACAVHENSIAPRNGGAN